VNELEQRLREAFDAAASTVLPGTLRELGSDAPRQPAPSRRVSWPARIIIPAAAAAAAALIAVLAFLAASQARTPAGYPAAGLAGTPEFLVAAPTWLNGGPLQVRDVATGALTSRIRLPVKDGKTTVLGGVSSDGRGRYVLAVHAVTVRETWLYQFSLSAAGKASALTPLAAQPTLPEVVSGIAASQDGQKIAYGIDHCHIFAGSVETCFAQRLAVLTVATRQTRTWAWPGALKTPIGYLSITADGSELSFVSGNDDTLRVMSATAAPGTVAQRSRIVALARNLGRGGFSFAGISPDGSQVFVTTDPGTLPWNVRLVSVRTGKARVISTVQGTGLALDPSGRELMLLSKSAADDVQHPGDLSLIGLPGGTASPVAAWRLPVELDPHQAGYAW
jgi:hypothetical protein